MREILTLNVGKGGVGLGQSTLRQYNAEHDIRNDGKHTGNSYHYEYKKFYDEIGGSYYKPRSIFVDLDNDTIDNLKSSDLTLLRSPNYLSFKEDTSYNFARGYYTLGKEIIDEVDERITRMVDNCDNVQGFIFNNSVSGGTGSGFGSLLLERIRLNYRKKSVIGYHIYSFNHSKRNDSLIERYNTLLFTHWILDNTQVSLILDNNALYNICKNTLLINKPTYNDFNILSSKVISGMTNSLRHESEMSVDMNEFETNLVPFPRLHFMISTMAPIIPISKEQTIKKTTNISIRDINGQVFRGNDWLVNIEDFNKELDKFLAVTLNSRGNIKSKEVPVQWLKSTNQASFVEWCPTGFNCGLDESLPSKVKNDVVALFDKNVTMIGNNTSIKRYFEKFVVKPFDKLYKKRSYIHWYLKEGMHISTFDEAREDLHYLMLDYDDVLEELSDD